MERNSHACPRMLQELYWMRLDNELTVLETLFPDVDCSSMNQCAHTYLHYLQTSLVQLEASYEAIADGKVDHNNIWNMLDMVQDMSGLTCHTRQDEKTCLEDKLSLLPEDVAVLTRTVLTTYDELFTHACSGECFVSLCCAILWCCGWGHLVPPLVIYSLVCCSIFPG